MVSTPGPCLSTSMWSVSPVEKIMLRVHWIQVFCLQSMSQPCRVLMGALVHDHVKKVNDTGTYMAWKDVVYYTLLGVMVAVPELVKGRD